MTDTTTGPLEWSEVSSDSDRDEVVREFQYNTAETRFRVVILNPSGETKEYRLRLSVVNPSAIHVRHNYPIAEYDSKERATEELQSSMAHLSKRFDEGSLSRTDPDSEAIRTTIQAFTDHSKVPSIRRLIRRIR